MSAVSAASALLRSVAISVRSAGVSSPLRRIPLIHPRLIPVFSMCSWASFRAFAVCAFAVLVSDTMASKVKALPMVRSYLRRRDVGGPSSIQVESFAAMAAWPCMRARLSAV